MEVNNSQLGGDDNAMEVNDSRLGLEPEVNIEDGNGVMQYEEDIVSSAVSNVHESSQDSLGPRASATNSGNTTNHLMHRTSDLLTVGSVSAHTNKTKIQDLASAAMEELREMATRGEPLWHRRGGDDSQPETLNSFEYGRLFGSADAKLEKLMRMVKAGDPNCMPSLDPSGHERLPVPRGDHYRPPTMPLEHEEQQSLEASRHIGYVDIMTAVSIVELFMSVVTWVEHAAVSGTVLVHNIYRHLVVSGFAFGAKRWASSLIRHCQWIDTLRDPGLSATTREDEIMLPSGRESLLKLSERMRRIFWGNFDASSGKIWMSLPIIGAEDIRVMIKGNIHFRDKPSATKLAFTTSIRLPVPPKTLFSFLCDGFCRNKATPLDMEMMYLQESFADDTGSYVIYAPIDVPTMSSILNGDCNNTDGVNILPCGFSILPERSVVYDGSSSRDGACGSLLTMAFNIIDDHESTEDYMPRETMITIYNIINKTAFLIRNALVPDNEQDNLNVAAKRGRRREKKRII
ncbi:hypothetical protein Dsin_022956 [Dipteronia sinensis]|uniref:START domain-containing protein n=1 Tax=Dipteronia sinensis TaxID=43782 RepID=A0AAE0E0F1_9ROSI|nr:hypothetical protein Dsin_022956 [Dipteronia sinensis]